MLRNEEQIAPEGKGLRLSCFLTAPKERNLTAWGSAPSQVAQDGPAGRREPKSCLSPLRGFFHTFLAVVLLGLACIGGGRAQDARRNLPSPAQTHRPKTAAPLPHSAPPVVTVVHRQSGIEVLRSLSRSGATVAAVEDDFIATRDFHTRIIAGFVLGDGRSVVARLPQSELEIATLLPKSHDTKSSDSPTSPELAIVRRDGQQLPAQFIGFDGWTGLALLQVDRVPLPPSRDASEAQLSEGQRVRLLAPERSNQKQAAVPGTLYLRLGEIEGTLAKITRAPSGRLVRLTVNAPHLSPAIVGGVVLNSAGETIGIVEHSGASEASVMPASVVRSAAERVRLRRSSVPRPLLGVSGEAVTATSLTRLVSNGWRHTDAVTLLGKQQGILLTSVAPGTPAALANLRAGDVIMRVNENAVKNVEDFSFILGEASRERPLRFTVLRKEFKPLNVSIKLGESFRFDFETNRKRFITFAAPSAAMTMPHSSYYALRTRGLEVVLLSPKAAERLSARGGLLVVFVHPESAAARAGLRTGDVVETVNGQPVSQKNADEALTAQGAASLSLSVARSGQRLEVILPGKEPDQH